MGEDPTVTWEKRKKSVKKTLGEETNEACELCGEKPIVGFIKHPGEEAQDLCQQCTESFSMDVYYY